MCVCVCVLFTELEFRTGEMLPAYYWLSKNRFRASISKTYYINWMGKHLGIVPC